VKAQETVDYHIKFAWHAISRMYNLKAVQHDISTSIGFILLNIDEKNGTPATKIGPILGMESRSLTRMLKTLEEKGLIVRKGDDTDRRLVRIFLTPEGKKRREVSRITVLEFNNNIRKNIPADKLKVFFEVVDQINQVTENQKEIFKEK
jgi:DNA-binding MarR family transcriptional regulator